VTGNFLGGFAVGVVLWGEATELCRSSLATACQDLPKLRVRALGALFWFSANPLAEQRSSFIQFVGLTKRLVRRGQ
jgi:hypothetical protein